MDRIFRDVLSEKKLSAADYGLLMEKVGKVIQRLEGSFLDSGIKAEIMLGGSSAKGTLLKGDFDCDVFVRFDRSYPDEELLEMLKTGLKCFRNVERVHGSRDYFQLMLDSVFYEFVPVIKINNPVQARNITDISPLHVDWIRAHISRDKGLVDEILLAKLFCKAQGIYGAESYISGFSGHVLDILIVYYGSFKRLLEHAVDWKLHDVIDVEGHGSYESMNSSKISPLVVFDPIQKERNAAAALGIEKFERFRKQASRFLSSPSESFFKRKKVTYAAIRKMAGSDVEAVILKLKALSGKRDIVGSKLLKVFNHINRNLEMHDFIVAGSGWDWDRKRDVLMWFYVRKEKLCTHRIVEGPPVKVKPHARNFQKLHADSFEKGGRLYARVRREFLRPKALVKSLLMGRFVRERVAEAVITG
ncbi:nucleotidyltransferase domain-containing protein [Candidatus Woesearchaeota archaeon]|nr:nucleotidyltransferase domain-containing protein [Candidatus Woesearchaeota archaeon]